MSEDATPDLALRRNKPLDLDPLARMLADPEDLAVVNPSASVPFDPYEWATKWLGEIDDESFYLVDAKGREVGFFALRPGIGPEQRHLAYVYVEEHARGGAGGRLTELAEEAARSLGAAVVTLKAETDNAPAMRLYEREGFEELGRVNGMATMRKELD